MSASGLLTARTFVAGMAIPLSNVRVTVTTSQSNPPELIAYRTTDEDGMMEDIPLSTPDLTLSQAPSEETPFSVCNIQFDRPEYYSILIRDVQIFPESRSIQWMEMLPLEENAPEDQQNKTFGITPQNL